MNWFGRQNKYTCLNPSLNPARDATSNNLFYLTQQEDQTRQFQQYMLRDPVPFSRIPAPLPKPLYSPTEAPPRDHPRDSRDIPFNPSKFVEVTRPEVSPQVVSAAATLATMDMGTRFPFNQQSFKQPDERLRRGPEQVGSANRKVLQNDLGVKGDNGMINK